MGIKRWGFVVPRFGETISGGAETLVGSLARKLSERGDSVTAITTCALDHRTWENHFPEGRDTAYGIPVERFSVDPRSLDIWIPLQIKLSEGIPLTVEEELSWISHSVNSEHMYAWIEANQNKFDALFFAPYLFGTTWFGALTAPHKSILIPCLHDEAYAYTNVMASMFRKVKGCIFNAPPEADLARRLYGQHIGGGSVGMGFEAPSKATSPYFNEPFPYLMYLGRKETGKNAHLLIDNFIALKNHSAKLKNLKLVIVGGGSFSDIERPSAKERDDILDLSHVNESEKQRLLANALCLVQPSRNESFSIVMMESWLQETPVVVHARCDVTRYHAIQSGGGLYFDSVQDFILVIEKLYHDQLFRSELGRAGSRYVSEVYSWNAVLARFDAVTSEIIGTDEQHSQKTY